MVLGSSTRTAGQLRSHGGRGRRTGTDESDLILAVSEGPILRPCPDHFGLFQQRALIPGYSDLRDLAVRIEEDEMSLQVSVSLGAGHIGQGALTVGIVAILSTTKFSRPGRYTPPPEMNSRIVSTSNANANPPSTTERILALLVFTTFLS